MKFEFSIIIIVLMICVIANKKTSQHKGVYWHQKTGKWYVQIHLKGQKRNYGGTFIDELDAAKRVNQLCEELGIPFQNPKISAMPNHKYQAKEKTSQYKGVTYHKYTRKWQAVVYPKGHKQKYGGNFNDELDAAKRVNELCEEWEIPKQNPGISTTPNEPYQAKGKISQYKGVCYIKRICKWTVYMSLTGKKQNYCGIYEDELDAAKKVNQLCEQWGIPVQNPGISTTPNEPYQAKGKTSQYKGVSYHKYTGKWQALVSPKGQNPKYGGRFTHELDAAKRVNELCKELGIPPQNPEICKIQNQQPQAKVKKSQYKGVSYHEETGKWIARVSLKGEKQKYGGLFNEELDAAKRVNELCEDFGIPKQNPAISTAPNLNEPYQKKEKKTSQYKGVYWHTWRKKWKVQLRLKEGNFKFGGYFEDELDAGKRMNQICEEFGIPPKNPKISSTPNQKYKKKEKTSQHKGVYWDERRKKWKVELSLKGFRRKSKYGGYFKDELDAGKKVNQLCEELRIPPQNPEISAIPTQQHQEECKPLLDYDAIQAELEDLIQLLGANNDPTTTIIQENLFAAINYEEQATMTEINLCTKHGESALTMAAQHGFSNAVKFLILKGANKEHFTNDHHTPLSLAVSQNHFKVVQVLLQDWISPNSHEDPYLHLLPIFNVKSREIAQILVDNDAVTSGLYNNKKQSPLTIACQNGFLDVAQFFLDDGLDINHLDNYNKTPLFYAHTNGHHELVNLLILQGAKQ